MLFHAWNTFAQKPIREVEIQREMDIIIVGDRPIGYAQYSPWSGAADEAREMGIPDIDGSYGLDIFIGEPDMVDRGV
ncbi:MAG: hypothetical protein ACXWDU_07345, partial [Actinomycetota bacterium]